MTKPLQVGALLALSVSVAVGESPTDETLQSYLQTNWPARVEHVEVGRHCVTIRAHRGSASGKLLLAELPIHADAMTSEQIAGTESLGEGGTFTLTLPRSVADGTGGQRDRLLSRWRIMTHSEEGLRPVSAARYADHVVPSGAAPHPKLRGKKGLGGFDIHRGHLTDLVELGISTVTVNLPLGFMHRSPAPQRTLYEWQGKRFYVDDHALKRFDATLSATVERELLVFGILLTPPPGGEDRLAHADYDPHGIFAMPDVSSPAGVELYSATLACLMDRYGSADEKHGRIHHWIVHNEIDAGWEWTNAGKKSAGAYMDLYHKSLRMVHLLARNHDPQAQAFISLTHSWTEPAGAEFYAGREMLDLLNAYCQQEGDFAWGVAYHPYPESLGDPATWKDEKATHSNDSPYVTFKNLEVLASWVRRPENKFRGKILRDVFLTEQGFHSPDYRKPSLNLQAAALAYAWKKMNLHPEIRGMHYHNWIDNRHEGGLRIGLRRFSDDPDDPGGEKPIWRLYRDLESPKEIEACRFALPIVGIEDWSPLENGKE